VLTTQVFADDLMQIYTLAKQNDATLQLSRANYDVIEQDKAIAESAFGTQVNVSATVNVNRLDSKSTGINVYGTQSLALSASKLLFSKQSTLTVEKTDVSIAQGYAELKVFEQSLMLSVAQAYFDILSAKDSLSFAKAENAAIARQLDQATQRFDVGLIAITDVHEAQAVFDQSNADLIAAETALDDAKEALYEITNQASGSLLGLDAELKLDRPEPSSIDAWSQLAQQENLSIKAKQRKVDVAKKEVVVQGAANGLSLSLVGSHAISRTSLVTGADVDSTSVGLQFNVPLYQGGSVKAGVKKATFSLTVAQQSLDKERRFVKRSVRDAYRAVIASISQVKALKASTLSSRSALEATKAGFDVGTRTIVDVLNSERDLYRSMSNLSQLRYNYILSGLSLKLAAGTLSEDDLRQVNGWLKP